MEKNKRIVSIVRSKSSRPPKITGPIAEPKTVKALNKLFIETYWSYKGAIFHPKNEFVVCKNDSKKIKNK